MSKAPWQWQAWNVGFVFSAAAICFHPGFLVLAIYCAYRALQIEQARGAELSRKLNEEYLKKDQDE